MLRHLTVDNVAVIEHTSVEFERGFNVLTGETGAGKSILIDALNFVLGERASHDIIRHGCDSCRVQASFDADEALIERLEAIGVDTADGELILSRTLTASGKSVCRMNGALVTLSQQKSIGDLLVDVHGQHEHQALLVPAKHIGYLDLFCGAEAAELLREIAATVERLRAVRSKLNSGFPSAAERERRIDILEYQINEIDKAELLPEEEQTLEDERRILANAEKIRLSLELACSAAVDDDLSALTLVKRALDAVRDISAYSSDYSALADALSDTFYSLDDASRTLRELKNGLDFDPERLEQIEARLDRLSDLKRKYGDSVQAILDFAGKCRAELAELVSSEEIRASLENEEQSLLNEYTALADRLSSIRKQNASRLSDAIVSELMQLGIPRAVFEVRFSKLEKPSSRGSDDVEFMLSTNAGEPVKPLAKVASGGEVSRIMLSLKVALSDADSVGTMIFDEIDSGISGRIASITGEKLCAIAGTHQVICITHLPQIAALADRHFRIVKSESDGRAVTSVCAVDGKDRVSEVARIMGDACASELAERFAAELIENGKKMKSVHMAE